MLLNLSDILRGRKAELEFSENFDLEGAALLDNHHYNFIDSVFVSGRVYRRDNQLWISLSYKSMVEFVCDRCLVPFEYPLEGKIERRLSKEDGFDVEWLIIRKEKLDLAETIVDDILLNLPIQLVCDIDCQGLCSKCGANLNQTSCDCVENEIDPRLEGLKALLE